jgi:hypothetical protein
MATAPAGLVVLVGGHLVERRERMLGHPERAGGERRGQRLAAQVVDRLRAALHRHDVEHVVVGDGADQFERHARQITRCPGVPGADAELERAGGEVVVVVGDRDVGVDDVDVDAVLEVEALGGHVLVEDDIKAGRERHIGDARQRGLPAQDRRLRDGGRRGERARALERAAARN